MNALARPKVEIAPRAKMTPARKARIHADHHGRCEECGKLLPVSGPEVAYDHIIPLKLGGRDSDDNLQPLCTVPCHAVKTAHDFANIAKAKRLSGETGQDRKRREIHSAGFPSRNRKFDGSIGPTAKARRSAFV